MTWSGMGERGGSGGLKRYTIIQRVVENFLWLLEKDAKNVPVACCMLRLGEHVPPPPPAAVFAPISSTRTIYRRTHVQHTRLEHDNSVPDHLAAMAAVPEEKSVEAPAPLTESALEIGGTDRSEASGSDAIVEITKKDAFVIPGRNVYKIAVEVSQGRCWLFGRLVG